MGEDGRAGLGESAELGPPAAQGRGAGREVDFGAVRQYAATAQERRRQRQVIGEVADEDLQGGGRRQICSPACRVKVPRMRRRRGRRGGGGPAPGGEVAHRTL